MAYAVFHSTIFNEIKWIVEYVQREMYANCMYIKKQLRGMLRNCLIFKWAHQGMILGPPDYESGALTN